MRKQARKTAKAALNKKASISQVNLPLKYSEKSICIKLFFFFRRALLLKVDPVSTLAMTLLPIKCHSIIKNPADCRRSERNLDP